MEQACYLAHIIAIVAIGLGPPLLEGPQLVLEGGQGVPIDAVQGGAPHEHPERGRHHQYKDR